MCLFFFFFNDTATTEIYTLSLHDALPIWVRPAAVEAEALAGTVAGGGRRDGQASVVAAEIVGAVAYGQRHTAEIVGPGQRQPRADELVPPGPLARRIVQAQGHRPPAPEPAPPP